MESVWEVLMCMLYGAGVGIWLFDLLTDLLRDRARAQLPTYRGSIPPPPPPPRPPVMEVKISTDAEKAIEAYKKADAAMKDFQKALQQIKQAK